MAGWQILESILTEFALRPDIDFAYPTQRFYNNLQEGKRPLPTSAELPGEPSG